MHFLYDYQITLTLCALTLGMTYSKFAIIIKSSIKRVMRSRFFHPYQPLSAQSDSFYYRESRERGPIYSMNVDQDFNGIVDGSEEYVYQIYNDGQAITIQTRSGRTFNDNSSRNWDVIAAADTEDGFAVLRAGTSRQRLGQYRIWLTDSDGQITSNGRWHSGEYLRQRGYEDIFNLDLNSDGQIGDNIADEDGNGIVDGSELNLYQIYNNGQAIDIQTRSGRTFNDNSNGNWDVIAAAETEDGFAVLRAGISQRRLGEYRIWLTDNDGQITSNESWRSGEYLRQQGYEDMFNLDLDNDGQIGDPPPDTNDDYDDTTNTSGYLEVGGTADGTLEVAGDRDWLRINLVAGNVYNFAVEGQTLDDTYLRFYDSSGNLLEENDDSNGLNSAINNYQAVITGDYYLGVGAYSDAGTGTYIVSANTNSQIGDPPPDTNDDYDDTTNTSGYLEVGGTADGTLEVAGDRDWLRINLVAGNVYNFAVEGQTLDDTYLRFYDSSGNLLEENDDSNGLNSAINNYQAVITGDYYLGVGAYSDAGTGTYIVSANEAPLPPSGYNSSNGYGQINIQRAFEQHLNISLAAAGDLGGDYWTLDNIYAPEVWRQSEGFAGATGQGVVVAVIDTGVDLDHREFAGRIVQGYDFVDNDIFANDGNGHGTHVAGTIAGAYDDFGVTGVAFNSQIMPVRVLGSDGSGYTSDIISGIRFAADNNADVINLSLGGGGYSQSMADAIEYATNRGSVVVMAAGNSGGISPEYPAAHAINYGLAVGAVDQYENLASFSNLAGSTAIDYVTAPGVDVYSSIPGDRYAFYSGTSMATPHVAGAAALLRGYDPNLSAESIEDLLTGTASNNISDSSVNYILNASSTQDEITNYSGYITSETISDFRPEELSGVLIGRISDTWQSSSLSVIASMPMLPSYEIEVLTSNLYALNLDGSMESYSYVSELLDQSHFQYFEVEQAWSIA